MSKLVPAEEVIGSLAAGTIRQLTEERDQARRLMVALLKHVGTRGVCRGCGAALYWVNHLGTGRTAPYDADGTNHFITCPKANDFRGGKNA